MILSLFSHLSRRGVRLRSAARPARPPARMSAAAAWAAAVLAAALPAWPGAAGAAEPARLPVVASFSILADMARQIGGDVVDVHALVGPDGDAHVYEPTPADARRLAQARVLVVNGLDFESWLGRLREASGFAGQVVVASQGVAPRAFTGTEEGDGHGHGGDHDGDDHDHDHDHDHEHDHDHDHDHDHGDEHGHDHGHHHHGSADPHAWQDLRNGILYARNIAEGLAQADPARADAYRARAEDYVQRMRALDTRLRERFGALPAERRRLVTSHDAFGYFGAAYGVQVIAVAGLSTEAEPSAADLARVVQVVRRDKVPAVFLENITSPRLVEQIARETGAKVGGTLYSDALSPSGGPAATYLDMFEWNAKQLLDALQP